MSAAAGAVSVTDKQGRPLKRWIVTGRSRAPRETYSHLWWLVAVGADADAARDFTRRRLIDHHNLDIQSVAPASVVGLR